jgi:hypothetical protein
MMIMMMMMMMPQGRHTFFMIFCICGHGDPRFLGQGMGGAGAPGAGAGGAGANPMAAMMNDPAAMQVGCHGDGGFFFGLRDGPPFFWDLFTSIYQE